MNPKTDRMEIGLLRIIPANQHSPFEIEYRCFLKN